MLIFGFNKLYCDFVGLRIIESNAALPKIYLKDLLNNITVYSFLSSQQLHVQS